MIYQQVNLVINIHFEFLIINYYLHLDWILIIKFKIQYYLIIGPYLILNLLIIIMNNLHIIMHHIFLHLQIIIITNYAIYNLIIMVFILIHFIYQYLLRISNN